MGAATTDTDVGRARRTSAGLGATTRELLVAAAVREAAR